jgi:hypothetical protein
MLSTSRLALFQGILPIQQQQIWKDVAAGLTLAALGIPEVMGYTRISQTPVVTGLYTLVLPVIVFAAVGSSRHLVVAADSATAAILAGALVEFATPFSPEYVALTGIVALLAAGMLLVARIFRLGFLADFLSRSALIGFLTGVGIQVAIGEFGALLGIPDKAHGTLQQLLVPLRHLNQIEPRTALVWGVCPAVNSRPGTFCTQDSRRPFGSSGGDRGQRSLGSSAPWNPDNTLYSQRPTSFGDPTRWLASRAVTSCHGRLLHHRYHCAERRHVSQLCHALQRCIQ